MSVGIHQASASAGVKGRGNRTVLAVICAFAFAIIAAIAIPASASAFNIANYNYTNTTLQAAGHPSTTLSFQRQGSESEDLRDVLLDLPTGVFANPEAANPKCTSAQFNADTCPASSKVGSVSMDITAASLLNITAPGSINVLTPEANQVATLGITVRPAKICILFIFCAQPDKVFLKTGITVRSFEDSGLRTYTPGAPRTTSIAIPPLVRSGLITLDITVKKLSLTFNSKANSSQTGPFFWTQTGSCSLATSTAVITSYNNVSSTGSKSFTPTGCASVPFNPTFSFAPTVKTYGVSAGVNFVLNIPDADATIQNALPKIVDADFPNGSGINLSALNGVTSCSEAQLKADACPASAIIGNATALSKYIPEGLTGPVYATGDVGNQVPIAVRVLGPRNTIVIFRGTLGVRSTGTGVGHVYARFDRIPQLPFRQFTLNITKDLYTNPSVCGTQTTIAAITGFNGNPDGTVVSRSSTYAIDPASCPVAPTTVIDSGPANPSTNTTPTFTFHSTPAATAFNCSVDGAAVVPCNSGSFTTQALTNGNHTFSVTGINNGVTGNTATYAWTQNTVGFTITPTISTSTTQAAAHPNLNASFDVTGGQPASLQVKMPAGFNASLAAVTPCATASALAGTCTAASLIGSGSVTASTFSGPQTGTGNIYLTDGPTAADAGGVAVKFTFPFGDFIAQAGAYIVDNGKHQFLDIRSFPTNVNGTDITITNLTLNLTGANNFLTNPSSCASGEAFTSSGTSFSGVTAPAFNVPYAATGCGTVVFNPTVNQTFDTPLNASGFSHDTADVNLPAGNGTIQNLNVIEPPVFGPNTDAFGIAADMCSGAAADFTVPFNPASCPLQSKVGTMTLTTPLLTTPLVGTIYLINKTPLPWFGVKFDQPGISVRLTGFTDLIKVNPACNEATEPSGFCQKQISVTFQGVPDVPVTHVKFALDSAPRPRVGKTALPGELLTIADPGAESCLPSSTATTTVQSWSGASKTLTQAITVNGC